MHREKKAGRNPHIANAAAQAGDGWIKSAELQVWFQLVKQRSVDFLVSA